jgi:hypothetical protein
MEIHDDESLLGNYHHEERAREQKIVKIDALAPDDKSAAKINERS